MTVDHRPLLERNADGIVCAVVLGIVGCALLGAGVGAAIAVHLTIPTQKGAPPC